MDAGKRDIYARYVLGLLNLSKCSSPRAAIIVGREGRVDTVDEAISESIIPGKEYYGSPIFEVLVQFGTSREGELFSSYFPTLEEFILLTSTRIRSVRYMGEIEDERTVQFLNAHTGLYPDDGFEIIKVQL